MKILNRYPPGFYAIAIGWALNGIGVATVLPFISVFFTKTYSLSIREIGIFFLATSLVRAVSQSYGGELSDTSGRKLIIIWSQMGRFLFFGITVIALYFDFPFIIVAIPLGISYIFASLFQPVAQAAIADQISPDRFVRGFSIVRVAGNLGWVAGPILGGYLAEISFRLLFLVSAFFSLLSGLVFVFRYKEEPVTEIVITNRSSFVSIFQDRLFLVFCFVSLLLTITVSQMLSSLPVFFTEFNGLSSGIIGYFFAINGLIVSVFQMPATILMSRFNSFIGMALGASFYCAAYILASFADNIIYFSGILFLISIGEILSVPLIQASVAVLAKSDTMGRYMGFFGLISVLGWSVGPVIGGHIIELFSHDFAIAWNVISLFALLSAFGYLFIGRHIHKKKRSDF